MCVHKLLSRTIVLASLLAGALLLSGPHPAQAGCGCDKPPPAPAAVIPNAAFPGMPITLFHNSFQVGQMWNVGFHSGSATVTVKAVVVLKRTLTDPSGMTYKPQLVVSLPNLPMGPASIVASTENASLVVPQESFTVIGKPVVVAEQAGNYAIKNYTTGVGSDGTLYISLGGLNNVCKPIEFRTLMTNYPLRFASGDVVIVNFQGFLVDSLDAQSADHFFIAQQRGKTSNLLDYWRHTFEGYCANHQPGGAKEVDPQDLDWHLDGTPHTDYSTLIFAIAGHFNDGSLPKAGSVSFDLNVQAALGDNNEAWAQEKEEERVLGSINYSVPSAPTKTTTRTRSR
jgi:hypothetical protein